MAGFDAPANVPGGSDEPEDVRSAWYGRVLFVIYLIFYSGYVFSMAFAPQWMELRPVGGINLSVVYGLALIAVAILFALFYDWLCRPAARNEPPQREERR